MMRRPAVLLALFACYLLVAACSSAPKEPPALQHYTLVLLKTGDAKGLPSDEQQRAFQGHFSNMTRLAEEKKLLVAGPYGQHRSDPSLRGIFILDTEDMQQAKEWASTDPCYQAGIFKLEYHDFATAAPLRAFLQAVAERDARMKAAGEQPKPGANARGYVWMTVHDDDIVKVGPGIGKAGLVIAGISPTQAMILLDAANRDAARAMLEKLGVDVGLVQLDEWYASDLLAEMDQFGG